MTPIAARTAASGATCAGDTDATIDRSRSPTARALSRSEPDARGHSDRCHGGGADSLHSKNTLYNNIYHHGYIGDFYYTNSFELIEQTDLPFLTFYFTSYCQTYICFFSVFPYFGGKGFLPTA